MVYVNEKVIQKISITINSLMVLEEYLWSGKNIQTETIESFALRISHYLDKRYPP